MIDLQKTFEEFDDEYRNFDKVENALSARADLCALLLLDKLLPSDINIIDFAGGDEIAFDVDCKKLAKVSTSQDILTLVRCGVRYDDDTGKLAMFV